MRQRRLCIVGKLKLTSLSALFTTNDIALTTVYFEAKLDDKLNQSVIGFHLQILITVINNDVVFISESCDSSDLNSSTNYHERLDRGVQTPLLSAMAGLQTRHFLRAFTLFSLLFLYNCSAKLNVFLEAKEVSRFLYGK